MSTYPIFRMRRENRSDISSSKRERSTALFAIHASQFLEFRDAIGIAKETFSQEHIWPDECDYVIHKMNPLKNTATSMANSIKKWDRKSSGHNRYQLLVSAHYFSGQVDMLIDCVREYREVGDQRSVKKSKQRLVVSSLYTLESSLFDLLKELDKTMKSL